MNLRTSAANFITFLGYSLAVIATVAMASDTFFIAQWALGHFPLIDAALIGLTSFLAALVAFYFFYQEGRAIIQMSKKLSLWIQGKSEGSIQEKSKKKTEPLDAAAKRKQRLRYAALILTCMFAFLVSLLWAIATYYGMIDLFDTFGIGLSPWIMSLAIVTATAQGVASVCQEGYNFISTMQNGFADKSNDVAKGGESKILKPIYKNKTGSRHYLSLIFTFLGYSLAIIATIAAASDAFFVVQWALGHLIVSTPALIGISCTLTALIASFFYCQEGNSILKRVQQFLSYLGPKKCLSTHEKTRNIFSAKSKAIHHFVLGLSVALTVLVSALWAVATYYGMIEFFDIFGVPISPVIMGLAVFTALAQGAASASQEGFNFIKMFKDELLFKLTVWLEARFNIDKPRVDSDEELDQLMAERPDDSALSSQGNSSDRGPVFTPVKAIEKHGIWRRSGSGSPTSRVSSVSCSPQREEASTSVSSASL